MSLGATLKQLRKTKGITLAELAERANSHVGNLSRIERGAARPSLDLLYRVAEALEFSLAEIFSVVDQRSHDPNQIALNTMFISLLERDKELLLDFARLLKHHSSSRQPAANQVAASNMPAEAKKEEATDSYKAPASRKR